MLAKFAKQTYIGLDDSQRKWSHMQIDRKILLQKANDERLY